MAAFSSFFLAVVSDVFKTQGYIPKNCPFLVEKHDSGLYACVLTRICNLYLLGGWLEIPLKLTAGDCHDLLLLECMYN